MTVEQIYPNNIHVWYIHVYSPERSAVHDFGYQVGGETCWFRKSYLQYPDDIQNPRNTDREDRCEFGNLKIYKAFQKGDVWGLIHTDPHQVFGCLLRGSFGYLGYVDRNQGFFTSISGLYVPKSQGYKPTYNQLLSILNLSVGIEGVGRSNMSTSCRPKGHPLNLGAQKCEPLNGQRGKGRGGKIWKCWHF